MTTHPVPFLKLVYSRPEAAMPRCKGGFARGKADGRRDGSGDDPYFGEWIEDYLQKIYADILKEPIPDDLLAIINGNPKNK